MRHLATLLLVLSFLSAQAQNNFVHRDGTQILDTLGQPLLFQGVCFGNEVWTNKVLPYTHHTEKDYGRVKDMGMNVVRFYMNHVTFQDPRKGFEWLDENVAWAKANGVYLILNMHVPPGGFQSNNEGGALWNNPGNQAALIDLWTSIAERYKDEKTIAAYDLLNEPVVTQSIDQWQNLSRRITKAIRVVDSKHLLFVERVNAINGQWTLNENANFFPLQDENSAYTFHFYDPHEYSHQNTSWTGMGEGGAYPDPNKVEVSGPTEWRIGTFENPKLGGTTGWTKLTGVKFKVSNPALELGKPALVGRGLMGGTAYFDEIEVIEFDPSGKESRRWPMIDPKEFGGWYYWSQNGSGKAAYDFGAGHNKLGCLVLEGSEGDASLVGVAYAFAAKQGYSYQVIGWVKTEDVPPGGFAQIRLDFEEVDGQVLTRSKEMLAAKMDFLSAYPNAQNRPVWCGEFGLYKDCFQNEKGGLQWVEDVLDIFAEKGIHFTYHSYHEDAFGIYSGYGTLPDPSNANQALIDLFTRKLKD